MTVETASENLSERIRRLGREHPEALIIDFEGRRTPWRAVRIRLEVLESALREAGVGREDLVGLVMRERPAAVGCLLALLGLDRPVVLFQALSSDEELKRDIAKCDLAAVLAEPVDFERAGFVEFLEQVGTGGFVVDENPAAVRTAAAVRRPAALASSDFAVKVPTSGTTGTPKRHPLSRAELDALRDSVVVRDPSESHGVTIASVPLSSIGGFRGLVQTVWRGRPIVLMERFTIDRWTSIIREYRPRRIGAAPAIVNAIVERDLPREWFDGVECLFTGSAPLNVDAARRFADRYGIAVLNAYGATEFGGTVIAWDPGDWDSWNATKLGSVGRPRPGIELRLVPHESTGDDDSGILEVRKGDGNWVRTNDIARIDEDNFVWILQRADDVIIRGGFKVRSSDVEAALTSHESVHEAIVVGIPHERLGAVPTAMVTLRDGSPAVTGEELRDYSRGLLSPYKVPVEVRIVAEIPRNAMMKPWRSLIREELQKSR